jgi:RNA polymerase sigma-70 factor (ECF subfamily)
MSVCTDSPTPDTDRMEEVLELFGQYQRALYAYIFSLLPSAADADDVLQETNIVVWQKFDRFQPGTDFRAWVFRIAYFEVRKFYERRRRVGVSFSEKLLDQLSLAYQQSEDVLEGQRNRLSDCVEKLRPNDRELVRRVYGQGVEVSSLAHQTGREQTSIYRSLRRIRQLLFDCVEGSWRTEATT